MNVITNKKLSYRRDRASVAETARCFVSLNISLSHSKSFENLATVSYSHFIATMAVSLAVCEIGLFSVKEWRDLEIWVWGRSMSLKNGAVR